MVHFLKFCVTFAIGDVLGPGLRGARGLGDRRVVSGDGKSTYQLNDEPSEVNRLAQTTIRIRIPILTRIVLLNYYCCCYEDVIKEAALHTS